MDYRKLRWNIQSFFVVRILFHALKSDIYPEKPIFFTTGDRK